MRGGRLREVVAKGGSTVFTNIDVQFPQSKPAIVSDMYLIQLKSNSIFTRLKAGKTHLTEKAKTLAQYGI